MKKNFVLVLMAAIAMVSCNNQSPKMDEQPVEVSSQNESGIKIAYVEVDSLMTQALQSAMANFQQKLQNNGFTSREQAESVQQSLQRQQNDLAALQARFESELANESQKFNNALRDSLNHFLEIYNKDKKYDMILAKSGDNILMANPKYDITQDVINGLNNRYKKSAKDTGAKDEKK